MTTQLRKNATNPIKSNDKKITYSTVHDDTVQQDATLDTVSLIPDNNENTILDEKPNEPQIVSMDVVENLETESDSPSNTYPKSFESLRDKITRTIVCSKISLCFIASAVVIALCLVVYAFIVNPSNSYNHRNYSWIK